MEEILYACLTFLCPNLCTGGLNWHGVLECITVQALETVSQLLVKIVEKTYAR